ncbi:MAG: ADP-ribosylglycohydrolase family protein [Vicinamibacterales bacterium]
MLGAIAGDIIGSVHEHLGTKSVDFPLFVAESRFTDDSVLAIAVADCLLNGRDYIDTFHAYVGAWPNAGYGPHFYHWARVGSRRPYNSFGNGAAMRVPAIGYAFDRLDDVLAEAGRCAAVTHDHPEGIKGAQATAAAIFLARSGASKADIKQTLEERFGYDLSPSIDSLRPTYTFDVSCQGTVPPALIAFLESTSFEDALRKAISLGGDADTLACITGGVAEAHYGSVPDAIATFTLAALDAPLRTIVQQFQARHGRVAE